MILRFLDQARAELGLSPQEVEFFRSAGIWSYETFHALLQATTGLSGPGFGFDIRRDELLQLVTPFLSPEYRAALAGPPPRASVGGAAPTASDPEPPDAPDSEIDLSGEAPIDLLGPHRNLWPLRDQNETPTCIAFATAACIEWQQAKRAGIFDVDLATAEVRSVKRLSAGFLYRTIRALPVSEAQFPGWDSGATKFEFAKTVLESTGICAEDTWPDFPLDGAGPGANVFAAAQQLRPVAGDFLDLPPNKGRRPPGVAERVLDILKTGRPVAIAVPEFRPPGAAADARSNWWLTDVELYGILGVPLDGWERTVGHAVCVIGFHPDPAEPSGGWFIFRNSMGDRWAQRAPNAPNADRPPVPGRGYGAIPATYVERHCWEIYSPQIA